MHGLFLTITNSCREKLDESCCRPDKIWLDKGSEFAIMVTM